MRNPSDYTKIKRLDFVRQLEDECFEAFHYAVKPSNRHLPLFAAALLAFTLPGRAESLQWKQKIVELTAGAKQEKVETAFAFQNTGAKRVTIEAIKPGCECTVAELAKKTFEPGETGELKVVFKLEGRVGLQEKLIAVTTDDAPDAPTLLTLRVTIPELIDIAPRLLVWNVDGPASEKAVDILLATLPPQSIAEIKTGAPGLETRLETIQADRQYRLFLKPTSTTAALRSTVFVMTKAAGSEKTSAITIYARVE